MFYKFNIDKLYKRPIEILILSKEVKNTLMIFIAAIVLV